MNVLAADIGGTNIRVGIVDDAGVVVLRDEDETPSSGSAEDLANTVAKFARRIKDQSNLDIAVFGLAIPGVIDYDSGRVSLSPNIPQMNGMKFGEMVSKATGVQVVLENDATAAAIGEHWLGAARGHSNAICITLGTGVGGGLIINGAAFSGADGTAGEIGHLNVEPDGYPCGCGSRGCLEQYASATAVVRMAEERLSAGETSSVSRSDSMSAKDLYDAAIVGDDFALSVFATAGRYLGIACADLVNLLNPEVIVFAGGLASAWEVLEGPIIAEMKLRAYQQPAERVKLCRGELDDDAGILGAAKQAFTVINKGNSRS
jgi:glucokinase